MASLTLFVVLGGISQSVQAKEAAETLEEIVVSASRKAQNLQEAAAVITVMNAGEIEKLRLGGIGGLTESVPGLSLDGSHKDQNRIGMRGAFSSADTPSSGQAVGLYIDGVYFGRSASMGPVLFDMEQIEVLRGPQGTLYGPNVVGGLINIQTKDPSLEVNEGKIEVTAGNFGALEVAGRFSTPLIEDELAASISIMKSDSDGWVRNLVTGNKLDQVDTTSLRLKALWTPNDKTRVESFVEFWQDDTFGEVRHLYARVGEPERFDIPSDIERTLINDDAEYDRDVYTVGLSVDYDISEKVTLKSITSVHETDSLSEDVPFLAGLEEGINATRDSQVETFTQEFLLFGEARNLDWQTGVYYYDDSSSTLERFESTQVPGTLAVDFGFPLFFDAGHFMENDTQSWSVFAQGTYAVADWINLTAGIRYTDEEKDSEVETSGDVFPGNFAAEEIFTLSQSDSWTETTPKLGIDMHWEDVGGFDAIMLYGTATKGFKSGDFVKGTTLNGSIGTTEPETVWNYEVGVKTTFWDGRANANVTVFSADYEDLQSQVQDEELFVSLVTNDAEAEGVEVEVSLLPVDGLKLSFNYAYLDTEITGDELIDGESVQGNRLPRSPENSFGIQASYEWSVGEFDLAILAAFTKQDDAFIEITNELPSDILRLTEQELLNLDFTVSRDNWELSFWGKNLTDDEIVYEGQDFTTLWSLTSAEAEAGEDLWNLKYGRPRTYGVTVRYEY